MVSDLLSVRVIRIMLTDKDGNMEPYAHENPADRVQMYEIMERWTKDNAVDPDLIGVIAFDDQRRGVVFYPDQFPEQRRELLQFLRRIKPFWCPLPAQRQRGRGT